MHVHGPSGFLGPQAVSNTRRLGKVRKRLQVFHIFRNFSTNLYLLTIQASFLAADVEGMHFQKQRKMVCQIVLKTTSG